MSTAVGWRLTVVVQVRGSGDQHEEEKGGEAESHPEQLCVTEEDTLDLGGPQFTWGHVSGATCDGDHMRSRRT